MVEEGLRPLESGPEVTGTVPDTASGCNDVAVVVAVEDWENEHVQRLGELGQVIVGRSGQPDQRPRRRCQERVRRSVVGFYRWLRTRGGTLVKAARRLRLATRTLRHWTYLNRCGQESAKPLGRPRARSERCERQAVIDLLKNEGPGMGVPALQLHFPNVPRAELRSLLQRYRRVVRQRYHDTLSVLHWQKPGRVWAIDFAEPSAWGAERSLPPIDGRYPYLVAVRDLASGYTLAWQPVVAATAEEAMRTLAGLFALHGPPLVLKLDNGPPFVAAETRAFLAAAGVLPLFSPPHWPKYNGTIEAGIGSLKSRTECQAFKAGRVGFWTWDDVEAARHEANLTARPHGEGGPTPAQAWRAALR